MTIDDVLNLLNAGFTKEEILQMQNADADVHQQDPEDHDDLPDPEDLDVHVAPDGVRVEPNQDPVIMNADSINNVFENAIKDLNAVFEQQIKKIQQANIASVRLPEDTRSPEQIIAKIIAPETKGKKGD